MPIPESQLEVWSHQGAVAMSQTTHESLRTALQSPSSLVAGRIASGHAEVYLQGSYRNATNVRGDSDVDLVVELNDTFSYDASLVPAARDQIDRAYPNATYTWVHWRADVLASLRAYYGSSGVKEGKNALKVPAAPGRLSADVVVCETHRLYTSYGVGVPENYVSGIAFYTLPGFERVVNYPKVHYNQGVAKQDRTRDWFKPTVRVFKNVRVYLVEQHAIPEDLACGYFIQSLLSNVPDALYGGSFGDTYVRAVNWLVETRDWSGFTLQNGIVPLFGPTVAQWREDHARLFVAAAVQLWNEWR